MPLCKRPDRADDPEIFNADVRAAGGYLYASAAGERFSSRHFSQRLTGAILEAADFSGKRVLDIGCGDGANTATIFGAGRPAEMIGIDPAAEAIKVAETRYGQPGLSFRAGNAYELPFPDRAFDITLLQGVIHHLGDPARGIREAVRVSDTLIITEPNGYNLGLKLIEKLSPYHRRHKEVSWMPVRHRTWLAAAGARVTTDGYLLIVPILFPEGPARFLAALEPFVERSPLRRLLCGTYFIVARHDA
ncbi:class I SAM-dependent methyltransferase [Candidatus Parcubacteria bacterium]|nr:class I SAM-dependent methyltransferase [Candidatus Parcubacteria bacterium]